MKIVNDQAVGSDQTFSKIQYGIGFQGRAKPPIKVQRRQEKRFAGIRGRRTTVGSRTRLAIQPIRQIGNDRQSERRLSCPRGTKQYQRPLEFGVESINAEVVADKVLQKKIGFIADEPRKTKRTVFADRLFAAEVGTPKMAQGYRKKLDRGPPSSCGKMPEKLWGNAEFRKPSF